MLTNMYEHKKSPKEMMLFFLLPNQKLINEFLNKMCLSSEIKKKRFVYPFKTKSAIPKLCYNILFSIPLISKAPTAGVCYITYYN